MTDRVFGRPRRTRRPWINLILAVAATPSLVGCTTVVDGQQVGQRADADERFVKFAVDTLDDTEPGHAEIVAVEAYEPHPPRGPRSGGRDLVIVLRIADGSVRALYVGCGVGVEVDRCFLGPQDSMRSSRLLITEDGRDGECAVPGLVEWSVRE